MSKKNYIIIAVALALIAVVVFWGLRQPQTAQAPEVLGVADNKNETIYFYGQECPHCLDVLKFLDDNKVGEKVTFTKKEVWHNKANAAEMQKRAAECGISPDGMGVPFVYGKGKCFVGTPDVEAFFKQAAGI